MNIESFLQGLASSGLGTFMNTQAGAFGFVESLHVMALALVYGTIMIVDLRLLGMPSTKRPFTEIAAEALKWTWAAFALAVVTGALLFITNPILYFGNTEFRVKMVLLLLAGINMAIFELNIVKSVANWDVDKPVPFAGRMAGTLSLLLWTGVIIFGRMIGFAAAAAGPFAALG